MKNVIRKLLMVSATTFLVLPFAAVAHDDAIKDCESNLEALADIADVEEAIYMAQFATSKGKPPGKEPVDKTRLLAKAAVAEAYVNEYKYADASSKLDDIITKVTSMLEDEKKKKINPDDGDDIITTTMHAMYCVVDLGA
jgi:hypothetical protein